ncbi:hypothetical protein [Flavobacterium polysaccharolyticum]|uniref:Uncharacterized protein n=1 Tax=Flavobacterium polysaccharolyticum TaxID=3133148 RepID=A0ABU9NL22_9FLAO
MKPNALICLFIIISNFSFAQTLGGTDQNIAPIYYNLSVIQANKDYRATFFKDIEGTPYIYKEFVPSEIEGVKSKMNLRYNAFDDVIEVEKNPNEIYTVSKDPAYGVIYMNYDRKKLRLITIVDKKSEEALAYAFELINNNKLALLRRDKIDFKEGKVAKTSFELNSKPQFTSIKSTYLLEQKDKKIIEFPSSKSKLLALYPSHTNEIKSYLKDNKIDLSDESDMIKTTHFLSTL